jgi:hypothetical protein
MTKLEFRKAVADLIEKMESEGEIDPAFDGEVGDVWRKIEGENLFPEVATFDDIFGDILHCRCSDGVLISGYARGVEGATEWTAHFEDAPEGWEDATRERIAAYAKDFEEFCSGRK